MKTKTKLKVIAIIPSRYDSSRLKGKPIKDINGKPMIRWVYDQAKKIKGLDEIYIATDDARIRKVCKDFGANVILTSKDHKTGTDRISEVASRIEADIIINIQGDEPLIEPRIVEKVIQSMKRDKNIDVITLKSKLKNPVDILNCSTVKVVANKNDDLLYLSRSPIPYPQASLNLEYFKTLGIYGFRSEILKMYKDLEQSPIELIEEIELLRLLENNIKIKVYEVKSNSISVDTLKDLEKVRRILKKRK